MGAKKNLLAAENTSTSAAASVRPTRAANKKATVTAGAPTRPTQRRRSPEEVQARILNAALTEFAEHSFSGARIDRISKRAKTVDRMLYYYFGSKERLYQAVLEHAYAQLIAAQRNFLVNESDPVQGMRQLVRLSWEHYLHHPELVRLLQTENLLRGKYLRKSSKIKGVALPLIERADELLKAGQRARVFRPDADPQRILMTVMSLGFFYLSNQYTTSYWLEADLLESKRLSAWGEHICDVVLNYLQSGV